MQGLRHAFVVPAYGQSPYLRDCLASLRAQTRPSPIAISTSTPSRWLADQAAEFGATLVEHGPNQGIGHDWNQAFAAAPAEWVTLAHQDDLYLPHFAEETLRRVDRHPDAVLVMTDYGELAGAAARSWTPMLAPPSKYFTGRMPVTPVCAIAARSGMHGSHPESVRQQTVISR